MKNLYRMINHPVEHKFTVKNSKVAQRDRPQEGGSADVTKEELEIREKSRDYKI